MPNIFISYRRGDSIATAGRIRDRLVQHYGSRRVFVDVDDIPHGQDFVKVIEAKVAACDVLLAVIGPRWIDAHNDAGGRRLDDPDDFVGIELGAALARPGTVVIPVLVDGANMPRADELPDRLKALARRNAMELRNAHFGGDAQRLIRSINASTGGSGFVGRAAVLAVASCVVLVIAAYMLLPMVNPLIIPEPSSAISSTSVEKPAAPPEPTRPIETKTAAIAADTETERPSASAKFEGAAGSDPVEMMRAILGGADGRIEVGIKGGGRVKLGDQVVFNILSRVPGRLIVIDVNANAEVTQIFPNSYVRNDLAARILANILITVPGPGYGFTGFKAVEPVGRGRLVAIVHPDRVRADRFGGVNEQIPKGFQPVVDPRRYLAELADELVAATRREGSNDGNVSDWGFAVASYEIVE